MNQFTNEQIAYGVLVYIGLVSLVAGWIWRKMPELDLPPKHLNAKSAWPTSSPEDSRSDPEPR